ncbi:hypothetical protein [Alicyclobacillus fastidiosus]|uniref:Uncharacterized protein n=1 Tax=Alicyclobacillus fastidiosus TaxID=392011 RepID=A0ABV5ANE1_9BACL
MKNIGKPYAGKLHVRFDERGLDSLSSTLRYQVKRIWPNRTEYIYNNYFGRRDITVSKRGVGAIFFLIAAILYSARYIAAASYYSGTTGPWSSTDFARFLTYVGPPWKVVWVAFIMGIAYLVWGEIEDIRNK